MNKKNITKAVWALISGLTYSMMTESAPASSSASPECIAEAIEKGNNLKRELAKLLSGGLKTDVTPDEAEALNAEIFSMNPAWKRVNPADLDQERLAMLRAKQDERHKEIEELNAARPTIFEFFDIDPAVEVPMHPRLSNMKFSSMLPGNRLFLNMILSESIDKSKVRLTVIISCPGQCYIQESEHFDIKYLPQILINPKVERVELQFTSEREAKFSGAIFRGPFSPESIDGVFSEINKYRNYLELEKELVAKTKLAEESTNRLRERYSSEKKYIKILGLSGEKGSVEAPLNITVQEFINGYLRPQFEMPAEKHISLIQDGETVPDYLMMYNLLPEECDDKYVPTFNIVTANIWDLLTSSDDVEFRVGKERIDVSQDLLETNESQVYSIFMKHAQTELAQFHIYGCNFHPMTTEEWQHILLNLKKSTCKIREILKDGKPYTAKYPRAMLGNHLFTEYHGSRIILRSRSQSLPLLVFDLKVDGIDDDVKKNLSQYIEYSVFEEFGKYIKREGRK